VFNKAAAVQAELPGAETYVGQKTKTCLFLARTCFQTTVYVWWACSAAQALHCSTAARFNWALLDWHIDNTIFSLFSIFWSSQGACAVCRVGQSRIPLIQTPYLYRYIHVVHKTGIPYTGIQRNWNPSELHHDKLKSIAIKELHTCIYCCNANLLSSVYHISNAVSTVVMPIDQLEG
jgi:hypothetical protein